MNIGECCARCSDHVLHATLVEADEVEVALDDDDRILFGDGGSAMVEPEEDFALVVERRFRAVHVLGALETFLFRGEVAPAEGYDNTRLVLDSDHQAVAELVVDAAVLLFGGKARLHAVAGRKAVLRRIADKAFAPVGGIADMEFLARLLADIALGEVLERLRAKRKLLLEPFAGKFVELADHGTLFGDLGVLFRSEFREVETHEVRNPFHRAVEVDFLVFLHELEYVPAGPARKALVYADGRVYRHGGGVVVVEGAYAHVAVRARALQRQELLDHKRNVWNGMRPKIAIICHPRAGGDLLAYNVCYEGRFARSHNHFVPGLS